MADYSTEKLQSTETDMKDLAFELFLGLMPKISETNVSEKQEKKN